LPLTSRYARRVPPVDITVTTTDGTIVAQQEGYAERWWSAEWWRSPWLDALAFAFGLGAAWRGGWAATDLVWSLWLSSLVVGYAIIVWTIARPIVDVVRGATREADRISAGAAAAGGSILLFGGLFALAFFTVHFGMFHYVHSQFLATFFPLDPAAAGARHGFAGAPLYAEVVRRYWRFLPAAFLAERGAFARPAAAPPVLPAGATTAAERNAVRQSAQGGAMFAPYRNVVRMHLLIFFFAFAHFARLDNFAVYTVIYAVYFLPWRLLKQER
jgi:hypothetical protein